MKLSEHVNIIRDLITNAFVNQFARLGVTAEKQRDISGLDEAALSLRSRLDAIIANHIEETGSYKGAFDKALDEYTFTLFNRLAALKVMESHRMFPEVVTKRAENGGRSFGHRAWLEQSPAMASEELEGLHQYIRFAFDSLGKEIRLYSQDSTYDMLPYVLDLNTIIAAVNAVEEDGDVGAEIWQSDDIMGWLYESYNLFKKIAFKDSGDKIEFDKVSLTSQVYTPRWVVEFLVNNSLGKLYLEMYPDSDIKRKYKIANVPATRVLTPKPLHKLRLIDPATGSANFLLYAFDLFYALYLDQIENYGEEYEEEDIPKLIIENNLYGVDLDDRAIQIAQLGLYIKALRKNSRIHIEKFNVVSSDFYLPSFEVVADSFSGSLANDPNQKRLIQEIWSDLQKAYQFGSLIRVEERFNTKFASIYEKMKAVQLNMFATADYENLEKFKKQFFQDLHNAVSSYSQTNGNSFLNSKTNDAITFLEILTQKYDLAVANPPYTSRREFGNRLQEFMDSNYRQPYDTYINLYASFVQRLDMLLIDSGKMAVVTPMTFMFISTFKDTRKLMLKKYHISLFVQYGFGGMFSASVDTAMYILEKNNGVQEDTYFIKLDQYFSDNKIEMFNKSFESILNHNEDKYVYRFDCSKLEKVESYPFIFWVSDEFRAKFSEDLLEKNVKVCQGLATGDNARFLRFWWEIGLPKEFKNNSKWILYAKGGTFNKWAGNLWLSINWENNGHEVKNFCDSNGKKKSVIRNEQFYLQPGITYSASGRGGYAFRVLPEGCIFDVGGSSIFAVKKFKNIEYILALLNSKLVFYIADCLNPTANIQVGDLQRVPFVKPRKDLEQKVTFLAQRNIEITKYLISENFEELEYKESPISKHKHKNQLINLMKDHISEKLILSTILLINESNINKCIFEIYGLNEYDEKLVVDKQGIDVAKLPVSKKAFEAFLNNENVIKYLSENELDELEKIEVLKSDISVLDEELRKLFNANRSLEDISKISQINPIDIWFYFNKSDITPIKYINLKSMELLFDITREIMIEDEDGIVPLVRNSGEDILLDRIENKFYSRGFTSSQFSSFSQILGFEINEFINHKFFDALSNHLDLFSYQPQSPFIWHITSGPQQGFDAYIIIYKWNRDKLFTLKSVYIEKRETALRNRQSDLLNENTPSAENEKDLIFHQLKEIDSLKKKIDELLSEGYDPKLDDGVGKNIAPLQKKGIIAYDVLNAGQLKKYLNADW